MSYLKIGSKAATILHLAEQVGIPHEDIISFGDGQNDREMLRMSGIGIAMGNAVPEVQAEAKMVTRYQTMGWNLEGIERVKRDLKEVVKSCSASSSKPSQKQKIAPSYFSFFWAYYRRCKLLNTV